IIKGHDGPFSRDDISHDSPVQRSDDYGSNVVCGGAILIFASAARISISEPVAAYKDRPIFYR
ncbi:hypothetical protein, partial [Candidatus Entotheonella palauensis]|uniref:hypothetical protein n=1 Tax=Candidatus Entotheonella palauensis TaxID=93172 RepID=UPI001C4E0FAB